MTCLCPQLNAKTDKKNYIKKEYIFHRWNLYMKRKRNRICSLHVNTDGIYSLLNENKLSKFRLSQSPQCSCGMQHQTAQSICCNEAPYQSLKMCVASIYKSTLNAARRHGRTEASFFYVAVVTQIGVNAKKKIKTFWKEDRIRTFY